MQSSNISDNQIGISGNVLVRLKKGKTILKEILIHNSATLNLLYNMLLGLSGSFDSDYLPKYIGVGTGIIDDPEGTLSPQLKSLKNEVTTTRALLTPNFKGAPQKNNENNSVSVVYQGIIPFNYLTLTSNISEIGLFGTSTGNTLLARIQLSESEYMSLQTGESLVVEWTFSIKNI